MAEGSPVVVGHGSGGSILAVEASLHFVSDAFLILEVAMMIFGEICSEALKITLSSSLCAGPFLSPPPHSVQWL